MKIKLFFLVSLVGSLVFSNCGTKTNPEEAQQKAWEEVMVIHDEIMPWMGELNSIASKIKAGLEVETQTEAVSEELRKALEALEAADAGMWKWMNELKQLDKLRADKSADEIMTYLVDQKAAIAAVKAEMETSMAEGKKLLELLSSGQNPEQQ